jgi:cell division protein FtsB
MDRRTDKHLQELAKGWTLGAILLGSGCSSPAHVRLSESAERNRSLNAEVAVLRDQISRLRTENRELAERVTELGDTYAQGDPDAMKDPIFDR